jgi:hypothetical protein
MTAMSKAHPAPNSTKSHILTFSPMDFLPVMSLSYGGALVWYLLNTTVMWIYGKRKQWDVIPLWARRKEK